MEEKPSYVMILTNYKLEEMMKSWMKLESDLERDNIDGKIWLANKRILLSCRQDLEKYFNIDFQPDWMTNPNSIYRQKLLEALNQDRVYIPTKNNGTIAYRKAMQGIDFEVIAPSGFVDIIPKQGPTDFH